jgi:hypothetical protein
MRVDGDEAELLLVDVLDVLAGGDVAAALATVSVISNETFSVSVAIDRSLLMIVTAGRR